MIRSAARIGRQLPRGLGFALVILVAAGGWALGSFSLTQAAASPGVSLASLLDNAASVSAYDYGDHFARSPLVPSGAERSSSPAAESGWVRSAFSGLEVLTYTPSAGPVRHGPLNPGPLHSLRNADEVVGSFRSGSYTQRVLGEETTLYRVYGGKAGELGPYWTRTRPSGSLQSQLDSALNPVWGNTATNVSTIRVPADTTIYEGVAAGQRLPGGGSLLGGGNQVYIPRVDPSWLVGR